MEYDALAEVYAFLVPDELRTPEGSAAAFAWALDGLARPARVLDCACGTGELAVGLALAGHEVAAADASPAMVARARALAATRGAEVVVERRSWDEPAPGDFDAVLCVGNALVHAAGRAARRTALAAMAAALRPGGRLALTSRNWEALRSARPGLEVGERLVERDGRRGLVVRTWRLAEDWDAEHAMEVAVAVIGDDGAVRTRAERLTFWPFTHEELVADVRACGLDVEADGWAPQAGRYALTARRATS